MKKYNNMLNRTTQKLGSGNELPFFTRKHYFINKL